MKMFPKQSSCVLQMLAVCVLLVPFTEAFYVTERNPPSTTTAKRSFSYALNPWGNNFKQMLLRKLRRYQGKPQGTKRSGGANELDRFHEYPRDATNFWESRMGHEGLHDALPMQWMKRSQEYIDI